MPTALPDNWQYQQRDGKALAVLLPGWASDARIFARLALSCDVLAPRGVFTGALDGLADALSAVKRGPVLLCGWSLGGFAAARFASASPELVARLVLVGVRRRYPAAALAALRSALRADRARCLGGFYRQCFLPAQPADFRRFRAELEPAYLADFALPDLLAGLDALEAAELTVDQLTARPTTVIHGARDVIAPAAEAEALARQAGANWRLLPAAGHAAMCAEGFAEVWYT